MQSAVIFPGFANTPLLLQQVQKSADHSKSEHPGKQFQSTVSLFICYLHEQVKNKSRYKSGGTAFLFPNFR